MKLPTDMTDAELTRAYDNACAALSRSAFKHGPYTEKHIWARSQAVWERYQTEMKRRHLNWRAA